MTDQTVGILGNLDDIRDRELKKLMLRVYRGLQLAAHRVTAHHDNPRKFPLPRSSDSLEALLSTRFKRLHPAKQAAAIAKSVRALTATEAERTRMFGDVARVALDKPEPIEAQLRALLLPAGTTPYRVTSFESIFGPTEVAETSRAGSEGRGLAPQAVPNRLEIRIRKVKCLEETSGPGSDEIALGGVSIDESGGTDLVSPFTVSNDFDEGETKTYNPPRRFTYFNITEGGDYWPKSYAVMFSLCELDNGGFPEFLSQLFGHVKNMVAPLLGSAIGGLIGNVIPGLGTLIGALVGVLIGSLIGWLIELWNDDAFPPITVVANIGSREHRFANGQTTSSEKWVGWKAHGGWYRLFFDWRLYAELT